MKVLNILDDLLQAGGNGVSAVTGITAVKGVEDDGFIAVLMPEIALHHSELVEVGHQSQVLSVHSFLFSAVSGFLSVLDYHKPMGAKLQEEACNYGTFLSYEKFLSCEKLFTARQPMHGEP